MATRTSVSLEVGKALADVLRRETESLVLDRDVELDDRQLIALEQARATADSLIEAYATNPSYATVEIVLRNQGDGPIVSADLARTDHALRILRALHGPHAADTCPGGC